MHEGDRTERMQRIRVGLTGLAVVLLIVLLATIAYTYVNRSAPQPDATQANESSEEPLSDLGVVPSVQDNQNTPADNAAR